MWTSTLIAWKRAPCSYLWRSVPNVLIPETSFGFPQDRSADAAQFGGGGIHALGMLGPLCSIRYFWTLTCLTRWRRIRKARPVSKSRSLPFLYWKHGSKNNILLQLNFCPFLKHPHMANTRFTAKDSDGVFTMATNSQKEILTMACHVNQHISGSLTLHNEKCLR